jgi:glycosyltransferase involved in cell wall biosynthesis
LAALAESGLLREIIVSDAGSRDDTVAIAAAAGAHVVTGPHGRGIQLIAGAAAATGDRLLFLHADCRLAAGWERAAAEFIARPDASDPAGYFTFALDDPDPAARRLERIVAWRCRVLGLPYGDQGLLIARGLYEAVGGFAPIPLMEDVDLIRRLGRGRLAPIAVRAVSSAGGTAAKAPAAAIRNLLCLSLYLAGFRRGRSSPLRLMRRHLIIFARPSLGSGKRRLARDAMSRPCVSSG